MLTIKEIVILAAIVDHETVSPRSTTTPAKSLPPAQSLANESTIVYMQRKMQYPGLTRAIDNLRNHHQNHTNLEHL